ncbi:unnamed protein product [Mytilus coruscus]|uniref:DZIP3-like HEPN domain-containing protein n=1 Tax=Mytilus coruscus TaxID=42192 RepID=A0A6J8D4X0_MYTCO|nr:unnamed protein product [Mytilus coruscus]
MDSPAAKSEILLNGPPFSTPALNRPAVIQGLIFWLRTDVNRRSVCYQLGKGAMQPKQELISIDERKVLIFNVVLVLFPKIMQLLLQSFITPRGLLNKYNNRDLKVVLTDTEKSEMEKLPKMTEFTIELCYKILRFEHLVPEPSSQWEVLPDEDHQEITDDIKRIVFDTNDVFNKLGEDVSNTAYETFKGKVEGIVARIDSNLGQESCKQCYEEVISLDTQLDICLSELQKLRKIDVTGTTTPSLSDMEIQNGERFARIGWVIIDIFPKILRALIQMKIAADVMFTHCSTPPHWGRFSYEEQNKLKSLNSSNTYDLLDIPLAYRLLRQFSLIKEPTNTWGQPPSSSDISTGDDIERIRYLRNNFAHRSNISTTQSEVDDTFSTFKDICRRMDVYFSNDRASGYENDVSRKETTPMDNQLRQKYQRSLQELEHIKLRFIEPPVKFYWGEAVEISLKNLRQVYKDEKDKRKVSKGSIILHVDILRDDGCSEESFQLTLVQFVHKVLQTGDLRLPTMGSVDVVLVQEDEYTKMQLCMQESTHQLCFDFEIEKSEFKTDMKLKAKLGETVATMLKHSNGKGQISDVSATISSGSFGEIPLAHPVFVKTETGEEISETGMETKVADRKDSTSFQRVKLESTAEEKYDEIFVNVDNLKCLLKIKGLPNDLVYTELDERPPDVKDTQLLYVEWTLSYPSKWNVALISSSIDDNLSSFHDEFSIDFVYNEPSSRLIIHTTTQRYVFKSFSSLEVAVKNLLRNILNVSNIKSTEPEDLSASVLIMTKPEEGEFLQSEFKKEVKTDHLIFGLKDNIVACEHCTKSFSCKNCASKMNHIRRLDQALKMKDQTIQKPELKKRKMSITSDFEKSKDNQTEDASKALNQKDCNILVDKKQALQKLGEIPLLDYCIEIYRTYIRDLMTKWPLPISDNTNEKAVLCDLLKKKKKRTKLITKLKVVIQNQPLAESLKVTETEDFHDKSEMEGPFRIIYGLLLFMYLKMDPTRTQRISL